MPEGVLLKASFKKNSSNMTWFEKGWSVMKYLGFSWLVEAGCKAAQPQALLGAARAVSWGCPWPVLGAARAVSLDPGWSLSDGTQEQAHSRQLQFQSMAPITKSGIIKDKSLLPKWNCYNLVKKRRRFIPLLWLQVSFCSSSQALGECFCEIHLQFGSSHSNQKLLPQSLKYRVCTLCVPVGLYCCFCSLDFVLHFFMELCVVSQETSGGLRSS